MSFMDRAKDLLDQHDDKVDQALDKIGEAAKARFAGHDAQIDSLIDQAQQRTGAGDTTAGSVTGPGVQDGTPAEEQQFEQPGDQGDGGVENAPEVPGGPGHVPPQQ